MNIDDIIQYIVRNTDPQLIGLSTMPDIPPQIQSFAQEVVEDCVTLFGEEASSDEWKCSRERYTAIVELSAKYLDTGSDVLVAYDGKGYLSLMLDKAGYDVTRIVPFSSWRDDQQRSGWRADLHLETCNLDDMSIPFSSGSFDCIVFSGMLERLALRHPRDLMPELHRVLRDDGIIIFSTPNICNISNVVSLINGNNIFWDSDIFFSGIDRHNREFTPSEVSKLFAEGGFLVKELYGVTDHANWRSGSAHHIYKFQSTNSDIHHPLMKNTILGVFAKTSF